VAALAADDCGHSHSWFLVSELLAFPRWWDQHVLDDDEADCLTYAHWMGEEFWAAVGHLLQLGYPDEVRVVFWFDN
jgi:hypothetical protein